MTAPATTEEAGALPPELAELAAVAAAADARSDAADIPPGTVAAPAPSVTDVGGDVAAMLQTIVAMAEPAAPYLPRAYTPEVCDRIGLAVAAVAEKRGWDLSNVMSPELMLLFVSVPPTLAAVKMAKDYYAWLDRQQRPAANDATAAPAPAAA